jgi:glycine/betaine/sarcosine/D-proline reductase family selenoprotein B
VGIPVAVLSALPPLALQAGANRVVQGVKIEHVCGDPALPPEQDRRLRRDLVERALAALATDVAGATLFTAR